MTGLHEEVRSLLEAAAAACAGTPAETVLDDARTQLDGPLRVAFAGRLKAGKSTLLNAVVGERLAATDATECTTVVTWYRDGPATRAWAELPDGASRQVRYVREAGGTRIDLGDLDPDQVERLVVETPSSRLRHLTLVDTPGLASDTEGVSQRTQGLLVDGGPGVDAVVYLMRHVHESDVGFLQSFHDDQFAGTAPVNAIGVLSRADEMAGGQANSLDVAEVIAARYREDPRVRAVVQTVVPVSGLLALAAASVTEAQYASLQVLAGAPSSALLSADRLLRADVDLPARTLADLLEAFGMFGLRWCVGLMQHERVTGAGDLSRALAAACGLEQVRSLLLERFVRRAGVLKAEAALRVLESTLVAFSVPEADELRRRVQAVVAGAHELTELRTLTALRTGEITLDAAGLTVEAERLLGVDGTDPRARLSLADDAPEEDVRPAAVAALRRWQRLAQHPFSAAGTRRVADVVRRTCEGLL